MTKIGVNRRARGQATVELALGVTMFTTVLLFGIHYAEVGVLQLRVFQAAHSSLWDTTGLRSKNLDFDSPTHSPFYDTEDIKDHANRKPAARAEELYGDFDGLALAGPNKLALSLARGSELNVTCESTHIANVIPNDPDYDALRAAYRPRQEAGQTHDGLRCNSSALVENLMEKKVLQDGDGAFFKADQVTKASFRVCGFGRRYGGSCSAGPALAIDDWALSGSGGAAFGRELEECGVDCVFQENKDNQAFKKTARRIYDQYDHEDGHSISNFIRVLFTRGGIWAGVHVPSMADIPVEPEKQFRMAFSGGKPNGEHSEPFGFRTREGYPTTSGTGIELDIQPYEWSSVPFHGAYRQAWDRREECWLGSRCDRSLYKKDAW